MARKSYLYDRILSAGTTCTSEKIELLTRIWVASSHDPFAAAAYDMMRKPSGTQFCVPPLTFIGFASEESRTGYYVHLIEEYKRCRKGGLDARRLALFHFEQVAEWLREQLFQQLSAITRDTRVACFYRSITPEPTSTEVER
jgi:hypothetical protein